MPENHWWFQVTRRGLAPLSALLPDAAGTADDLDDWLDREDIPDGVPYLISPDHEYDIDLNRYFLRLALMGASRNTEFRLVETGHGPVCEARRRPRCPGANRLNGADDPGAGDP